MISVDLTNNKFAPPYLPCVDYMGQQNVINEYGDEAFTAGIGAEIIRDILININLEEEKNNG